MAYPLLPTTQTKKAYKKKKTTQTKKEKTLNPKDRPPNPINISIIPFSPNKPHEAKWIKIQS